MKANKFLKYFLLILITAAITFFVTKHFSSKPANSVDIALANKTHIGTGVTMGGKVSNIQDSTLTISYNSDSYTFTADSKTIVLTTSDKGIMTRSQFTPSTFKIGDVIIAQIAMSNSNQVRTTSISRVKEDFLKTIFLNPNLQ